MKEYLTEDKFNQIVSYFKKVDGSPKNITYYGKMKESQFQNKVIKYLKKFYPGIWLYKAADNYTAGIPDIICCHNGYFYAIELKVGKNKTSKLQSFVIRQILKAGGKAGVAYTISEVDKIMRGEI